MHVVTLSNNKGGITKTTSTINLGYGIARKGHRVLIIDTDAQCNTTYSLTGKMDFESSLFDVLIQGAKLADTIVPTQQEGLDLAPSSINLSAADLLMASAPGRERKLAKALIQINGYDFVLIDTPPNLGVLTVNAFMACDSVIIPIALTTYALIGISILEQTMQELRDNLDVGLPILGVIANLDDHTRISKDVLEAVKQHFGDKVFETVIPRNIKVEEAHNQIACLYDYAPQSTGARAYAALVEEVLARVSQR
jgi:chromosome partitioning protein